MAQARRHICLGFTDEPYPEGTHICYFYNDEDERRRILPLFARQALLEHDSFDYLADVATRAELPRALDALELTPALADLPGQVEVATAREGYYPDGRFRPEAMLARLRATYLERRAAGLAGVRSTGEMSWVLRGVPGAERLVAYESGLNALLDEVPLTVMCQYDLRRFDGALMFDLMSVHPLLIVGGQILRNPFYRRAG